MSLSVGSGAKKKNENGNGTRNEAGGFHTYLEQLEWRSADELRRKATKLVATEKKCVARLIAHLAEIARRKLHLKWGYQHLFDYCHRALGLSEGSIALRIQVANACRKVPELLEAIAAGRVSLTVGGRLAPHITATNAMRLLADCSGMTRARVQEYLTALAPKPAFASTLRRAPVSDFPGRGATVRDATAHVGATHDATTHDAPLSPADLGDEREATPRTTGGDESTFLDSTAGGAAGVPGCETTGNRRRITKAERAPGSPGFLEAARPELYNFRFSGGVELKRNLERLAEVLGIDDVTRNMSRLFAVALDMALEKKDPKRRVERRARRERNEAAAAMAAAACPDDVEPLTQSTVARGGGAGENSRVVCTANAPSGPARSRHVPVAVRDRVLARAGYRCEYRGDGGVRCGARCHVEIEHSRPFARAALHEENELRAYCRRHNMLAAEQVFGKRFISRKIEAARSSRRLADDGPGGE